MSDFGWGYLREQWYAIAWGREIGRELTERWLLNAPLVLYRTQGGDVVTLDNRCIHHRYPLSRGRLSGDDVVCGYHGFTYDCSGKCTHIPGQDTVPPQARVRSYPTVERWQWIWVWMGDPARADEALIPNFFWMQDPGWVPVGNTLTLKARYELLNENLLDLSHVEFVHQGSIGVDDISKFPIETAVDGNVVRVTRDMVAIQSPPLFAKTMGLEGRIDRWQVEEWTPPCYHVVHVSAAPTGTPRDHAYEYKVINAVVPERRNTTRYLWAVSRNYARDQDWVTDYMGEAVQKVFMQDVEVCEAQEEMIASDISGEPELMAKIDAGVMNARRIMRKLQKAEASRTESAAVTEAV